MEVFEGKIRAVLHIPEPRVPLSHPYDWLLLSDLITSVPPDFPLSSIDGILECDWASYF